MAKPALVIDNGTGYTKMGYSGNCEPQYIIPTTISTRTSAGTQEAPLEELDIYIGNESHANTSTHQQRQVAKSKWQPVATPKGKNLYFWNTETGESQWEAPLWMDEVDTTSGAVYYVNTNSGETQWDKPFGFVPVVRHRDVSLTPEGSKLSGASASDSDPDLD